MATMTNTKFEAIVTNTAPRDGPRVDGVNATSFARWTFGDIINITDPTYK